MVFSYHKLRNQQNQNLAHLRKLVMEKKKKLHSCINNHQHQSENENIIDEESKKLSIALSEFLLPLNPKKKKGQQKSF